MIAVLKSDVSDIQKNNLIGWLKAQGVDVHLSEGKFQTIIGLVGDTSRIDIDLLNGLEIIDHVMSKCKLQSLTSVVHYWIYSIIPNFLFQKIQ